MATSNTTALKAKITSSNTALADRIKNNVAAILAGTNTQEKTATSGSKTTSATTAQPLSSGSYSGSGVSSLSRVDTTESAALPSTDATNEVTVETKDPNKFYAAGSLDELAGLLQKYNYNTRSEDELRAIAEALYKNEYDTSKLNAQQKYDTDTLAAKQTAEASKLADQQGYDSTTLALQQALADNLRQYGQSYDRNVTALNNQLAGINTNADRQLEAQAETTRNSMAAADRLALSRGMQRSSYNAATQANMALQGDKALANIEQDRANSLNAVNENLAQLEREYGENTTAATTKTNDQIALLQQQLAQNLGATDKQLAQSLAAYSQQLQQNNAAADSAYQTGITNKINELMDQDYTRSQDVLKANNDLQMQLYSLMLQQQQINGSGSSGGSYGGSIRSAGSSYGGYSSYSKKSTTSQTDTTTTPTGTNSMGTTLDSLFNRDYSSPSKSNTFLGVEVGNKTSPMTSTQLAAAADKARAALANVKSSK